MQPMAARLGVDHQRLQQFITSSTWDYVRVGGGMWRDGSRLASQPEALVVDDTGFPKDGIASPVRGPAVFRHAGQDRRTARSG